MWAIIQKYSAIRKVAPRWRGSSPNMSRYGMLGAQRGYPLLKEELATCGDQM